MKYSKQLMTLLLVLPVLAMADNKTENKPSEPDLSNEMHVTIFNQTSETCRLTQYAWIAGTNIDTSPLKSISVGNRASFVAKEYFYGADHLLQYTCGTQAIIFRVTQSASGWWSSKSDKVILWHADSGIRLKPDIQTASDKLKRPGVINITLKNT